MPLKPSDVSKKCHGKNWSRNIILPRGHLGHVFCGFFHLKSKLLGCPGQEVNGSKVIGSMGYFTYGKKWGMNWGYNPRIPTFDPNFQRDIQVSFTYNLSEKNKDGRSFLGRQHPSGVLEAPFYSSKNTLSK